MSRYYNAMDTGSEELEHYGVQGMKWGVRKYVDYNGKLTSEGKRKYGNLNNAVNNSRAIRGAVADVKYRQNRQAIKSGSTKGLDRLHAHRDNYYNRAVAAKGGNVSKIKDHHISAYDVLVTQSTTEAANREVDRQNGYSRGARVARSLGRTVVANMAGSAVYNITKSGLTATGHNALAGVLSTAGYVSAREAVFGVMNNPNQLKGRKK